MNAAIDYFESIIDSVVDESADSGCDFAVTVDADESHIDLKGTLTRGDGVVPSFNEVAHARKFPQVGLFVMSNIQVTRSFDRPVASGGDVYLYRPWSIHKATLAPTD